mmetsp:Transcript_12624/g.39181  ORF Transcript_12624/g.39181 Transcript_12624/m.39181 type:complete len:104 (-) Transcript_12624:733-1044(-)
MVASGSGSSESDALREAFQAQQGGGKDPFGFSNGSSEPSEPDQLKPGFATAEGATLGPVSSALLWVFLGGLFALSLAFTSVPRDAATRFVPDDLAAEVAAQAN